MPVLSLYSFRTPDVERGGAYAETHVAIDSDGFGSAEMDDIAPIALPTIFSPQGLSVLALSRPDDEDVLDLADMYNNFGVSGLPMVMGNQPATVTAGDLAASLIGSNGTVLGIRSTPLNRQAVPSYLTIPSPGDKQVLTEMHIDFRLDTRAVCYSHTGTITVYVQFLLQRGILSAVPIAETFTPDTNLDICAGQVNDQLNSVLFDPATQGFLALYFQRAVQQFLQAAVDRNPPKSGPNPPPHSRIYGLPGDGKRSGTGSGTMDLDFSIGLERTGLLQARARPIASSATWPWR